jgi:phosphopantetheinyl transferase (holo-ACP synthase)
VKSPKLNGYRIDGVQEPLSALKGAVPDAVLQKLNLSDDNLQDQHNAIFLLNQSPGKVALKLSELIDLNAPLAILKHIKQQRSAVHTKMNALALSMSEKEALIKALQSVPGMHAEYLSLMSLNDDLRARTSNHTELCQLIENAVQCKKDLLSMPDISALPELKKLIVAIRQAQEQKKHLRTLRNLISVAQGVGEQVKLGPELLPILLDVRSTQDNLERLESILSSIEALRLIRKELLILERTKRNVLKEVHNARGTVQLLRKCKNCGYIDA